MKKRNGQISGNKQQGWDLQKTHCFGGSQEKERSTTQQAYNARKQWQPLRGESQGFSAKTWELILV